MLKRTVPKLQDDWDDAREKYFYHEDPRAARRKIQKEDLDTLEVWDESGEQV